MKLVGKIRKKIRATKFAGKMREMDKSARTNINIMQSMKAAEFCDISIKECKRALKEKEFDAYDKRRWKKIVYQYLGKKSSYFPKAKQTYENINKGAVTPQDYVFIEKEFLPMWEKEKTFVMSREI